MPVQLIRTRGLAAVVITLGALTASLIVTNAASGASGAGAPRSSTTFVNTIPTALPSTVTGGATVTATASASPGSVRWGGGHG